MSSPSPLLQRLTALGDQVRLRILRLLDRHELSVGELARILQMPQSTVSRHLKQLHDGAWITRRTEGTASLFRLLEDALDADARALWRVTRAQIAPSATIEDDDRRTAEVLAERHTDSRAYFGTLGAEWDRVRRDLFGAAFTAESLVSLLQGEMVVADLGCGTGDAADLVAPHVNRVIAVDREASMLDAARHRLAGHDNVEFVNADLTELPLPDASIDAAMTFLVLHHVDDPQQAITEALRTLRPGGRLLIVDMLAHDRADYRHSMGHVHLGFDEATVRSWATGTGAALAHFHHLRPDTNAKGPGLFAAVVRKRLEA